jgi:probable rRNA maturation factor
LSIKVYYDKTDFRLKGAGKVKQIIDRVIMKEGRVSGDLCFIFTDDESLREINVKFLNHDYNTDVITFDYDKDEQVNGEIYMSIDTIRENSAKYNVTLKEEVLRVMIHGVLHLAGYDDKDEKEKLKMREMENLWLEESERIWDEL